jgi:hypothetical protein
MPVSWVTMRFRLALLVCALLVVAGSPGDAEAHGRCSAATLRPTPQAGLPAPVAGMRTAIQRAAVRCDYARLAALAGRTFTYSFGGGRDPSAFWRGREAAGEPVLRRLVQLLSLPPTRSGAIYAWPRAYRSRPSAADWKALERVYPKTQVASWRRAHQYLGLRAGISARGDWLFFVAGD